MRAEAETGIQRFWLGDGAGCQIILDKIINDHKDSDGPVYIETKGVAMIQGETSWFGRRNSVSTPIFPVRLGGLKFSTK